MTVKVGEIACFAVVTIRVNDVITRVQVAHRLMSTHCSDILFACLLHRFRGHEGGEERLELNPH